MTGNAGVREPSPSEREEVQGKLLGARLPELPVALIEEALKARQVPAVGGYGVGGGPPLCPERPEEICDGIHHGDR